MNHSLLIVDLAGKLFGLLAAATVVIYVTALVGLYGNGPGFEVTDFLCLLFVFLKLMEFLSPGRFEGRMLDIESRFGRLAYHASNLVFIVLCAYLLWRNGVADTQSIFDLSKSWGVIAIAISTVTFILVFASGLAFRAYGQYSHDIMIGAVEAPETGEEYRSNDLLDKLCLIIPLVLSVIPSAVSFLANASETIPTAKYYRWENENDMLILGVLVGIPILAALIAMLRGPFQRSNGTVGSSFMTALFCLAMAAFSYFGWTTLAKNRFVPIAANFVLPTDKNKRTYIIRGAEFEQDNGVCVELEPLGAPDISMKTCGYEEKLKDRFVPGSTVEFMGKLTSVGHTLDSYKIMP